MGSDCHLDFLLGGEVICRVIRRVQSEHTVVVVGLVLGASWVLIVLLVVLLFVVEQGCASVEQIRFAAVFEGDVLFGAKFARRHTQWSEAGSAGHWSGRVTKNWALVWHVRLCSCILCRDIRSQTETTESMVLLEHGHRQLSLFSTE
jgi:hypothetical protein